MAGWVPPWEVQSHWATRACFYPWVSPPLPLLRLAFCSGRRCCNVLLMWQESERPTHTHTHSHRFSRSAIESKTQKLLAAYHFFFPALFFFFSLVGVQRDGGRELKKRGREGNGEGGETTVIGKKHRWLHAMGPPLFFLSVAVHTLRGREIEGVKLQSMLETCAVVPAPPCYADSTRSGWVREATGTHTKTSCLAYFWEKRKNEVIFPVVASCWRSIFACL